MSATLIITLPNAAHSLTLTRRGSTQAKLIASLADAIRSFASHRGVSVLAVDYRVAA